MDGETVWNRLKEGNARFRSGKLGEKDVGTARKGSKNAQHPFATILTCSDSRVPPELIFDANVGELFVIRNAGNVIDDVVLGTIEYGVEHLHTPLLIVMTHEKCGAVTAACKGGECPPNIERIMEKLAPSVQKCCHDVEKSADENAMCVVKAIREESEVVRSHEKEKKLKIVAMKYYFEDGRVELIG